MTATDTGAKVRAAAMAAIEKQCFGEDFTFDCMPGAMQTPTGITVLYTLIVTKKSPILGHGALVNLSQVPCPDPSAEQVEKAVTDAMRKLRELSAQKLAGLKPIGPSMPLPKGRG